MAKHVVIVGGVATGAKAAARIKRRDPEAEVTMLEQGEIVSYGACGLPYFIADVVKDHELERMLFCLQIFVNIFYLVYVLSVDIKNYVSCP